MKPIETFHVAPALPEKVQALRDLAYNLYWSWHPEVIEVFRRLDRDLWESSGHNPVRMLGEVRQGALNTLASDEGFLAQLRRAWDSFQEYLTETGYVQRACEDHGLRVGYFSMEYGLTECLSIYSGGLGMLAGDHLKSASDLGVDLVAVVCSTSRATRASISTLTAGSRTSSPRTISLPCR
jgi:starch phosphorylase